MTDETTNQAEAGAPSGNPPGAPNDPPKGAVPAPPASKSGFFSGLSGAGGAKKPEMGSAQIAELAAGISNASTRLRILEERYENLRKKMLVVEQNMLENSKRVMTEIRASDSQIRDFGHVIEKMKEELKLIIRELKLTAKSDEMDQLKRYISVWEPLNFVLRSEVKKLIIDAVEEKLPALAEGGFFEEEIRKAMKSAMGPKK